MVTNGKLTDLVAKIQINATFIEQYLDSQNIPPLSFDTQAIFDLPPETQDAQQNVLEAADELFYLVQGPRRMLVNRGGPDHNATVSLHTIIRFDICKAFPVDRNATFEEIGQYCSLPTSDVVRILRHAMTYYIFSEPQPGVVSHTAASRMLAEDGPLKSWIGCALDALTPASVRMVDAMEKWPASQEPAEAGFNVAMSTKEPMFAALGKDKRAADQFALAMKSVESRPGMAVSFVLDGFDWSRVTKVVDIGGNRGKISIALAKSYPNIHCIVQDIEEVLKGAAVPLELERRVSFMPHDFFKKQPVTGADVYYLRWVLHDWSDLYAARILRALIPALETNSVILINEYCLPAFGAMSLYKQRWQRATDLAMKAIQNGKERSAEDWAALLELADHRFQLEEVHQPVGSELSLLVVRWNAK